VVGRRQLRSRRPDGSGNSHAPHRHGRRRSFAIATDRFLEECGVHLVSGRPTERRSPARTPAYLAAPRSASRRTTRGLSTNDDFHRLILVPLVARSHRISTCRLPRATSTAGTKCRSFQVPQSFSSAMSRSSSECAPAVGACVTLFCRGHAIRVSATSTDIARQYLCCGGGARSRGAQAVPPSNPSWTSFSHFTPRPVASDASSADSLLSNFFTSIAPGISLFPLLLFFEYPLPSNPLDPSGVDAAVRPIF